MRPVLCRTVTRPLSVNLKSNSYDGQRGTRVFSSEAKHDYDVVFIGAGPGGYVGAIKAAQLGLRTACVERAPALGGTCLNVGCIPSKSLLHNTHLLRTAQSEFKARGIRLPGGAEADLAGMMAAKERSVKTLTSGLASLFKKNGVELVRGTAKVSGPNEVSVAAADGKTVQISAGTIVVATGSQSAALPNVKVDEERIVTSTGALSLKAVPKHLVVVGGGIIGLELGSVWARLGAKVTVVEYGAEVAGGTMDAEIAGAFTKILQKQGLSFMFNTKVLGVNSGGKDVEVSLETAGKKADDLQADTVLVSVGRTPSTAGLGLQEAGVRTDSRGFVEIDEHFRTAVPSIRAIGDAVRGPMLAHKAEEEGAVLAEMLAAEKKGETCTASVHYGAIPSVVYTHPEVAWVGLTEAEAAKKHGKVSTGRFPFLANSRARTVEDAEGMVKVVTDAGTDRLLGVHIVGPHAGELIAEAVLAMHYGASSEDVARVCHAHPTFSEAVKEAALATHGLRKPINA